MSGGSVDQMSDVISNKRTRLVKSIFSNHKRLWFIVGVVSAQLALLVSVFFGGYIVGQDVGLKKSTVDESLGAINGLFANVANPAKSYTGKVESISTDSITVKLSDGQTRTTSINQNTKISQMAKVIASKDVKPGQKASVFLVSDQGYGEYASRIIINK